MSGFSEAASFLTAAGKGCAPSASTFRWFPAVGLGLGAVLGGLWVLSAHAWPAPVAAAIVVVADLALTGMLHFDGLVDSADGLLAHLDRARRLEVLADPRAGAFGVVAAAGVLLLRWVALAGIAPDVRVLAALWCLSRSTMALVATRLPYARPGGLASAFLDGCDSLATTTTALVAGFAVSFALAAWWQAWAGAAAIVAAIVAGASVAALARRRLGGFTGDVLGAAGVVAETAGLLVAAGRW